MTAGKIFHDEDTLKRQCDLLKKQGKKIVFTNGCFDILHAGHALFLEEAKEMGDFLIVAVNSNQSVSHLKGETRPIIDEEDRMILLAAMQCTDAVVLFKEPTPEKLINLLLPHILVKGNDYDPEKIVGYPTVVKNGGSVVTIPFRKNISTSTIIEKIARSL